MIKNFSLIEAPIYQGQKHFGVSLGPAFLRQLLLDQKFYFNNIHLQYAQSQENVNIEAYENLSYLVERELRRQNFPFIVGGDHSLSIGTVQGILRYRPQTKVIWIDAHGDINTRSSSLTKSFHGMPLAFLTHEDSMLKKLDWFKEKLDPKNLIYFGLRDLDLAEQSILEKHNIQFYTTDQIHSCEKDQIIEKIRTFCAGHEVHVSLDADAFDPEIAFATGVPVKKGLTYKDVEELIKAIQLDSQIISYEFVELNPQIFSDPIDVFKTAYLGIQIFKQILTHKNQLRSYYGITDRNHKKTESILDYRSL